MLDSKGGRVAQLVEQCPFKAWVAGSSPAALTKYPTDSYGKCLRRPAAVEANATVGEISDTMRNVFGEYKEAVVIQAKFR